MRVSKQWTDEGLTARKSGSGPRNVTSACEDRRLVRMVQTDRTAFSRQLTAQWSTATRFLSRKTIAACGYNEPNVHRSWRADWQQVVFSDKSRFNLWHHDGRIRVRLYAGERRIPECIIERHIGTNTRSYGLGCRSISWMITIATNCGQYEQYPIHKRSFTALRYSFPCKDCQGAVFQQDNARPHVAKTVKSYLDSQQVQLLPWPAYSPDMSPIEHEWDIVGRRIARDLRPVASTDEL
ncbi:transposable element Tc1 transposase [Trichonephila clavipes]|nr:transposable element Tc1 transposase [Trichonephila clavipes]